MTVPDPSASARSLLRRLLSEGDVALSLFLVFLLATTVLVVPLREVGAGTLVFALVLLTFAVGVMAIVSERRLAIAAGVVALAAGYEHTLGHDREPLLLTLRLGFFSIVCLALLARVFRPGRVTAHRILGAVAVYVLLGVAWGTAFQLLVVIRPDAVLAGSQPASLDEAMWLSFITLTTTGYGDVLPTSPMARSLAVFEAIVGVLYPAILISRLVSLVQGADPVSPRSDAT